MLWGKASEQEIPRYHVGFFVLEAEVLIRYCLFSSISLAKLRTRSINWASLFFLRWVSASMKVNSDSVLPAPTCYACESTKVTIWLTIECHEFSGVTIHTVMDVEHDHVQVSSEPQDGSQDEPSLPCEGFLTMLYSLSYLYGHGLLDETSLFSLFFKGLNQWIRLMVNINPFGLPLCMSSFAIVLIFS